MPTEMKHSLRGVLFLLAVVALFLGIRPGSLCAADDSDTFVRALAFTNEVYGKNHMTVLADVEWTKGPKQSFRYDRYPEVERVEQEKVSYARKTGGAWLKSEDWAKTGRKVGADKSAELDGLVSIVAAALHKNLTPPGAERSIAEIAERRTKEGYEWVIFETRKEKTVTFGHPQFVFAVHGGKDEEGTLVGYAGIQRMGDRELRANLNFSVMFAVKIVESTPAPGAGAGKGSDATKTLPTLPYLPPQSPPADANSSAATPTAWPAPEKEKIYGFMELTLHGKELVGKVVQVEVAPKPTKGTDLHNGLFRVRLFDANPAMPGFGFVDCSDEGLKKLGLEDGSAQKNQKVYLLVEKEKLSGMARFTAIGTRFEPGVGGVGTYSW
jgi:hypothetical protein